MSSTWLTTNQVAQRLGVKPATVYAYVSRGLLHRELGDDGRTSRFEPTQVDDLARRGRPRRDARRTGVVDVVLSTALTEIRDGELRYRGHDAVELVASSAFEDVAEMLWTGSLPERTRWRAPDADLLLARAVTGPLGTAATPADRVRVATAAVASARPLRVDLRSGAVTEHARSLLATLVDCLPDATGGAAASTGTSSTRRAAADVARPAKLASRLWPKLAEVAPNPARVRALDAALVLLADHELASSTLAARVAASTRSDPYDVVLAGLGAVSGPLHGGASELAYRLVNDAAERGAHAAVDEALRWHRHVPGFGHTVYRDGDPRATTLLALLETVGSPARRRVVDDLVEVGAGQDLAANVDLALAALLYVADGPPDGGQCIFTVARVAGWVAHYLEELDQRPLRFRARAVYAVGS